MRLQVPRRGRRTAGTADGDERRGGRRWRRLGAAPAPGRQRGGRRDHGDLIPEPSAAGRLSTTSSMSSNLTATAELARSDLENGGERRNRSNKKGKRSGTSPRVRRTPRWGQRTSEFAGFPTGARRPELKSWTLASFAGAPGSIGCTSRTRRVWRF
jgi:hypothetical protein